MPSGAYGGGYGQPAMGGAPPLPVGGAAFYHGGHPPMHRPPLPGPGLALDPTGYPVRNPAAAQTQVGRFSCSCQLMTKKIATMLGCKTKWLDSGQSLVGRLFRKASPLTPQKILAETLSLGLRIEDL